MTAGSSHGIGLGIVDEYPHHIRHLTGERGMPRPRTLCGKTISAMAWLGDTIVCEECRTIKRELSNLAEEVLCD